MTSPPDERALWDMLGQATQLPYGAAQIALVEQVIAHADAQHLAELSFRARLQATTSYVYGGEPARSFVTFSWCLAESDRDPVRYARFQRTLLWQFKATITGLTKFPEVPLDRTRAVLEQMQQRWQSGGHSMHAVYQHRHFVARHVGDLAAAEEWYRQWVRAPRDDLSDCLGCDPSSQASWLASCGRDEEAVALAEPVLSGRLTCSEQPQGMLTVLLKPYLRTGRLDQARDAHRRAYRRHQPNLADLSEIADHIEFCALTGNTARGIEILTRHLSWLDRPPSPYAAMSFAAAGALVLYQAELAGHGALRVHRPAAAGRAAAEMAGPVLRVELAELALAAAARFDARNETTHQSSQVQALLDAVPLVDRLSLAPATSRRSTKPAGPAMPPAERDLRDAVRPAGGRPDDLLDQAEDHLRHGRRELAAAAYDVFDRRYVGANLTNQQRGRRADAHGIDAAFRGALAEAETAWRSALDLFTLAGDEVRRQATRARLGRVMCGTDRGEEGIVWVEQATSYLLAHAEPSRWGGAWYTLAISYGELGRAEEALAAIDRADEHAEASLDPSLPAVVAIGRAQFLGFADRLEEARAAAEEGVRRSRAAGFADGLAHASLLVGAAALRMGDVDGAVAAYDEALSVPADGRLLARVRAQRAELLAGSPRAGEVVGDLEEAVAELVAADDQAGAAQARHGLAVAYLHAGRPLDCAETAEEALAWFGDNADDDAHARQRLPLRHLLAQAYLRLDQPEQATVQLEIISAVCAGRDEPAGVGQMAEEIGDIYDIYDRDSAAAVRYLAAADAFRSAGLAVEELRARRKHALSLVWADDVPAALHALALADELSLSIEPHLSGDQREVGRWEQARLLQDGAWILRGARRLGEAAIRAESAAASFRRINASAQAVDADVMHVEVLLEAGRPAEAEAAVRRALATLPEAAQGREWLHELLHRAVEAQHRPDA